VINNNYLLLYIDDLLNWLKGISYFIKIDLKSGYFHACINSEGTWKTTYKINARPTLLKGLTYLI